MAVEKSDVIRELCKEISIITRKEGANIDVEESLRSNGIDSMSFLELLLFIKNEWNIDYIETGLPENVQSSITALADHICSNLGAK